MLKQKRKLELEKFHKNNERLDIVVIIKDYEQTGLNVQQLAAMLVEIMGGVDIVDPGNPKGLPYFPSVTRATTEEGTLSIYITVTGNRNEIYRLKKKFMNLVNCCKYWREKEACD